MKARIILALAAVVAAPPSSSFAQCDSLVVKYDTGNWWWGAFGHCKQHGGTTNRDAIFECAWSQVPAGERLPCLKARLQQTEQTRQAIDDVASFNGPPNSCDQLMVKYDRSNWWWGAFGHCKQHGGTTNRDAIFECAWNQVPGSERTACLKPRLKATEFTRQGIDTVAAFNGPPNSCDQLMLRYDGSTWWWGAFGNCKKAGGPTDRDAIFECAWNQVPAQDRQTCLKSRLRQTEVTRKGIDSVAAANGAIASNYSFQPPPTCPDPASGCPESCELPTDGRVPGGYFAPQIPQELLEQPVASFNDPPAHNIGANEGRLRSDLRAVARLANPLGCSLHLSAIHFGLGNDTLGKAFADLSVTGRNAFAIFKAARPGQAYCDGIVTHPLLAPGCPAPPLVTVEALAAGCKKTLDRAYAVANFLRTGQVLQANPDKKGDRDALGWIAVSGEDDGPHRPVNVPSSDFPQYDIAVAVETPLAQPPNPPVVTVSTRFVVAQSRPPALPPVTRKPGWTLRPEPPLAIGPNAEVLVFVHGMDSRAEEANDITKALFKRMAGSPRNLVVISMDLPSSGYATNLDYEAVSPLAFLGGPKTTLLPTPFPLPPELQASLTTIFSAAGLSPPATPVIGPFVALPDFAASGQAPLLDFIESFVVRFVDAVDGRVPIKGNVRAVFGGSLGGSMSFRLGRRPGLDWLPAAVVWSPASIWDSLGGGAELTKHWAVLGAWDKARKLHRDDPRDRAPFFDWDTDILPGLIPAQAQTWASDYWPCKKSAVAWARLDRHETYDAKFQSWHWRLATEQLLYSHQSNDASGRPRYMSNYKPMLLACGTEDEVRYNNICSATQKTAPHMTMTPGKAFFLEKTGHSLDNERRDSFARLMDEFLGLR